MNGWGPRDLIVLSVLVLCCDHLLTCSAWYPKEITVYIRNMLDEVADLTYHCKSKDDDLGIHLLQTNQEYSWHFHDNIGGTTQFWCNMSYEKSPGVNVTGHCDIYIARRDVEACGQNVRWQIRGSGMYRYSKTAKTWEHLCDWNK